MGGKVAGTGKKEKELRVPSVVIKEPEEELQKIHINVGGKPESTETLQEFVRWVEIADLANLGDRVERAVRALCRANSGAAAQTLIDLMININIDPKVRVVAAKEILDRGIGKVTQVVENKNEITKEILIVDAPRQENYEEWLKRRERAEKKIAKEEGRDWREK